MNEIVLVLEGEASYNMDAIGNETAQIEPKTVIGKKKSVYENDFFHAGQLNIKPYCIVEIYKAEYNGAKTALIDGRRLTIYRTFEKGQRLELYLAERTGNVT